jgi:hypothetical protein
MADYEILIVADLMLERNFSAERRLKDDFLNTIKDNELSETYYEALTDRITTEWMSHRGLRPLILCHARYAQSGDEGHVFTTMTTLDMACILQQHLGVRMLIMGTSAAVEQ